MTIVVLLSVLSIFVKGTDQASAVITPSGYNATLDPEASFSFQCDVTGSDGILWIVDGVHSARQDIKNRGISESDVILVNATTGSYTASISLARNITNSNTTIICVAVIISSAGVPSEPVLFRIQGLLDAPSNLMLSDVDNQHTRRLSWDEPFSLHITDVDPDIDYYKVCFSLLSSTNKSWCTRVNQTEYTFLNVTIPLLFTVSAVNVVGKGNASSTLHNGNGCANTTDISTINPSHVQTCVLYSFKSRNNPVARFLFQQVLDGTNCLLVYQVETSLLSAVNTTDHGIQIPGVVQYSKENVQLSLIVDSDLQVNEEYSATITAISSDGERGRNVTVEFEGSQAQRCILAVCIRNGSPAQNNIIELTVGVTVVFVGGVCFAIVLVTVVVIVKSKNQKEETNQNLQSESELGTRNSNPKMVESDSTNAATESSSYKQSQDSPTFPLYTEVMSKGKHKASKPEVPQKRLTEEDLDLHMADEEIYTMPINRA